MCSSDLNCNPWTGGTNRLHCYAESSVPAAAFVYPQWPRGGERMYAGSVQFIDWHAAVPAGAGQPPVTLELSTLGPDGPFAPVAAAAANSGRYQWHLPETLPPSQTCHLRLTLGTDPPSAAITPAAFEIVNPAPPPLGDMNCDGVVDFEDINPFVLGLSDPATYLVAYPACGLQNGDCDFDGAVDFDDINCFVALLAGE